MFYKSLRECCRLCWPDMRILPEDDRVWLQQVGSGLRCARQNLQRGLQLCKIASCADLHPALHVCWDTAEAHFYHGTQLTMIVSIWVWSLGGKSFNCFSVMMFCSRSFIIYFVWTYFTVTVDHRCCIFSWNVADRAARQRLRRCPGPGSGEESSSESSWVESPQ